MSEKCDYLGKIINKYSDDKNVGMFVKDQDHPKLNFIDQAYMHSK